MLSVVKAVLHGDLRQRSNFQTPTNAQVPAEVSAINNFLTKQKTSLQEVDSTIDGFNIGMNCGETAGQTIFHCHVHLIPRRKGDVENPRGGVRHIIAGKGFYEDKR